MAAVLKAIGSEATRHDWFCASSFFFGVALWIAAVPIWSADPEATSSHALAVARLRTDLTFLSSDDLEGRGIFTPGIQKAADYLRDRFQTLGLASAVADGSYFQTFYYTQSSTVANESTKLQFTAPDGTFRHLTFGQDYMVFTYGDSGQLNDLPIVFAGYGITAEEKNFSYDDYTGVDVTGKIVVLLRREPQQQLETSVFDGNKPSAYSGLINKVENALAHRAAAVLLVNDPFGSRTSGDKLEEPNFISPRPFAAQGILFGQLRQTLTDELLASTPIQSLAMAEQQIDRELKPITREIPGWKATFHARIDRNQAKLANVAAMIPGDGTHGEQTIVIGAHYDHVGYGGPGLSRVQRREIHNGADDNASGTVALLELARRFAEQYIQQGQAPPYRILFLAFSAEESGLIGSRWYVEKDPLVPLTDTVAMINFDMVGRLDQNRLVVAGTGTAAEFKQLVEDWNASFKFNLTINPSGYGPSDHDSFFRKNIPVLHFFTDLHPDYHTPTDDVEKINMTGLAQIVDYSYAVSEAIMKLPNPPTFVKETINPRRQAQGAYLGIFATNESQPTLPGLPIATVAQNSPAETAGLQPGDRILQFNQQPVSNFNNLIYLLRSQKPGDKIEVKLLRPGDAAMGNQEITVEIILTTRP